MLELPFSLPYFGQLLDLAYLSIAVFVVVALLNWVFPRLGMWTLLAPGGVAVLAVIVHYMLKDEDGHGGLWPLFLALAFFLYLWWLVALVLDLVFIWHRYIRNSKYNPQVSATPSWQQKVEVGKYK